MGITLSHTSALDVVRASRARGEDLRHGCDYATLTEPSPWAGARWGRKLFLLDEWSGPVPGYGSDVHVLVPHLESRIRIAHVRSHVCSQRLPPHSVLRVGTHASMVCPELLFLQMASVLSLPALVMLGHELCGTFSRDAQDPLCGRVALGVPRATTLDDLRSYVGSMSKCAGLRRAREALRYVHDNAASAPEALLATVYSLPPRQAGYGMGPLELNRRVRLGEGSRPDEGPAGGVRSRYPDIMFSFAPLGINYDGEGHLDLDGLVDSAAGAALADAEDRGAAMTALREKKASVRAKAVDDMRRDRELMAEGAIVLPMTSEDLYEQGGLDAFTRSALAIARNVLGMDVGEYEATLNDTFLARDRSDLLRTLLPSPGLRRTTHGCL